MKSEFFGLLSFAFLGLGIFFPERPAFSICCFLIFAVLALIQVLIEDHNERNIFKK